MSLSWHRVRDDGAPDQGRLVVLAGPQGREWAYDVGEWRSFSGGYWSTRGETKARELNYFTHWAYFEGPP